jgi:hypothetical protein
MTDTTLPGRVERAYTVVTPPRLEVTQVLSVRPGAATWDLHGDRLLYSRYLWRYQVLPSAPTTPVDWGVVETQIVALPRTALPMTDCSSGTVLCMLDSETNPPLNHPGPNSALRKVETLAADPDTGIFAVYSHRHVPAPYITDLACYDPSGGRIGSASTPQPADGADRWWVPHAVIHSGSVYAIERKPGVAPSPFERVPGHVVRRGVAGGLAASWAPPDDWYFPHSVSVGNGSAWVVMTRRFEPEDRSRYDLSYVSELDPGSLVDLHAAPALIDFGFGVSGDNPYFLGNWWWTGQPSSGGVCLIDGTAGGSPRFLASGLTPAGYDPEGFLNQEKLFRFKLEGQGVHLADLGNPVSRPMSRTWEGVVGCHNLDFPRFSEALP